MNLNIFSGLPEYVRITILAQMRRLLSTPLFNYDDKEDIAQDLLLFYLRRFYSVPDPDEALVVYALQQYATTLISKRQCRHDFLYSSLEDNSNGDFSFLNYIQFYDNKVFLNEIIQGLNDKEKAICSLVCDGYSMNQISVKLHINKRVVRRFFEKMQKIIKK